MHEKEYVQTTDSKDARIKKKFQAPIKQADKVLKIMAIDVIVRGIQGATVVDFHGRLDMYSRWHVKAIINQCCYTEREHLILNLHGLSFVDSAGLGFLVLCSQKFKELDRRITWVEPQGFVGDLINNLQLHNLIAICATEQDALA